MSTNERRSERSSALSTNERRSEHSSVLANALVARASPEDGVTQQFGDVEKSSARRRGPLLGGAGFEAEGLPGRKQLLRDVVQDIHEQAVHVHSQRRRRFHEAAVVGVGHVLRFCKTRGRTIVS